MIAVSATLRDKFGRGVVTSDVRAVAGAGTAPIDFQVVRSYTGVNPQWALFGRRESRIVEVTEVPPVARHQTLRLIMKLFNSSFNVLNGL